MKKLFLLLTKLIFPLVVFSQELEIKKEFVLEKFRTSINELDLEGIWLICDKNDNYSKNDTLWVYNHVNYFYHTDNECCQFVSWNFYTEKKFHLAKQWICHEPPYRSKYRFYNNFKIKLKDSKEGLILIQKGFFKKNAFIIDKMEVVELWDNGHKAFRMRLIKK